MEFHVACVQASGRVAIFMDFGGWNTVAWIMSAQVINYIIHGIILYN